MSSIVIVGGGVIGLLSAYELDRAGQQVTLIDRRTVGQESSWAGGGIISPLYPWRYAEPITRLAALSQQLYPELIQHMQQATGKDAEFLASGMLILGIYDDENPLAWSTQHRINMIPVQQQQLAELAPEISKIYQNGWWLPDIHQVRNPRLIALIKAYLQTTNIHILENEAVTDIIVQNNRVTGIQTNTQTLSADRVVIASGAWSSALLRPTRLDLDIKPIKGQMLLLKGPENTVKHITLSEDRYIIPRKDGHVLVGSTTEDTGFNKDTSERVKHQLHDYALRTIPALQSFSIERIWAGLRPGVKNGIPAIGKHPELENLYINSGHYRNGLVMAPASARLLCEIILRKPTCLAKTDYTPHNIPHKKN